MRVKFLVLRRPRAGDEVDSLIPRTLIYRSIYLNHLNVSLDIIVIALFTNLFGMLDCVELFLWIVKDEPDKILTLVIHEWEYRRHD